MKKINVLIGLIVLVIFNGYGQGKNSLEGTWELDREDNGLDLGSEEMIIPITRDSTKEKPKNTEIILKFKGDKLDYKQGDSKYKADYQIDSDKLILGTTVYKIIKLDSDSLIIVNEGGLFPTTYYYFKSDKKLEETEEFENYEEKYSNGNIKIKGTYHNGFEDGLWEEWYENGQKKSERYFKEAIPVGIWKEWDEEGKLVKSDKKQ